MSGSERDFLPIERPILKEKAPSGIISPMPYARTGASLWSKNCSKLQQIAGNESQPRNAVLSVNPAAPAYRTGESSSAPKTLAQPARAPNRSLARALAFEASSSRFFGAAFVSSERRSRAEISTISSTASTNGPSFAVDGLLKPLIFLTNWIDAARISSAVTGGSKLNSVLIFLHTRYHLQIRKL